MRKSLIVAAIGTTTVLLLGTFLVLGVPSAAAGEQEETGESGSEEKDKQKKDETAKPASPLVKATGGDGAATTKTYSNEDLEKMFGGSREVKQDAPVATPSTGTPGAEEQADVPGQSPLDELLAQEKAREEHRNKITAAEKAIVEAEQRVKDLERDALAQRNPFYGPRPKPPEDEEERAEYEQAGGAERVALADQRVEQAREALAKAKADLESLRRSSP